jgi:hypothetical protein
MTEETTKKSAKTAGYSKTTPPEHRHLYSDTATPDSSVRVRAPRFIQKHETTTQFFHNENCETT